MRRLIAAFVAVVLLIAPSAAQTLPADPQVALDALILGSPAPTQARPGEPAPAADETIFGMSYGQAALVATGVVAGAALINTVFGANLGTILGVLYVGHLVVEAALVASGAGAAWGFGWFDEGPADAL